MDYGTVALIIIAVVGVIVVGCVLLASFLSDQRLGGD